MKTRIISFMVATLFAASFSTGNVAAAHPHKKANIDKQLQVMSQLVRELQKEIDELKAHRKTEHAHEHKLVITTSPYVDLKSAYDANDLLATLPTMNTDLTLLRQRQQLERQMHAEGKLFSDRSVLTVGGGIEGQAIAIQRSKGHSTTDLDLTRADINVLAQVSEWATGFLTIAYDNSPLLPTPGGLRVANSRFFLPRGFMTVGNLNQSPFYATFGQLCVPFGRYATNLLSPPLTLKIGRTAGRALLFGYERDGLSASLYTFHGDAKGASQVDQWGINIANRFEHSGYKANIGAGYIANMADSNGMRSAWTAFNGGFSAVGKLAKRVPGMNFHGEFSKGPYDLFAEYVGATESFDPNDLSFNGHGAKPQAGHLEMAYHPKTTKPSTIGIGYDQSWQVFNIPQKSWFAVAGTSFWKNTIEALEYRRDISNKLNGSGRENSNTVVAQVGFYF